jgi:hypothetical protein
MPAFNLGGFQTTRTIGLYSPSPAIDRIPPANCTGFPIDQRSVGRPQGVTNCDVGAFEGDLGAAPDADGDTVDDPHDNCPSTSNANQANNEGDAFGDLCDTDDDNDTVLDVSDNCPTVTGVPSNAGCPAPAATPTPPAATPTSPATTCKPRKKKKKKHSASAAKKKKKKKKC